MLDRSLEYFIPLGFPVETANKFLISTCMLNAPPNSYLPILSVEQYSMKSTYCEIISICEFVCLLLIFYGFKKSAKNFIHSISFSLCYLFWEMKTKYHTDYETQGNF